MKRLQNSASPAFRETENVRQYLCKFNFGPYIEHSFSLYTGTALASEKLIYNIDA